MPRLPTFTANVQPGQVSGGRRAGPEDLAVDLAPVARSLQQTGDVLLATELERRQTVEQQRREAERLRKEQEAKDLRDASIRGAGVIAKGRNDFLTYLDQTGQRPMSEVPNVVDQFNKDFDGFRDKALEAEQNPEGRRRLEVDLDNLRGSLLDNAMRLQASRAGLAAQGAVRDVFGQNAIAVQKDPAQLERLMQQESRFISTLDFPGLTDQQRQRLAEERRYELPGLALGARIAAVDNSRGAKALKTELETNKRWQELLSGEQYARAMNTLNRDIKQYENAERARYRELLTERIQERAAGVDNGLSLREAGGDPKIAKAIDSALAIGKARESIRGMPYSELVTTVNQANQKLATPGDFTADRAYLEAVQTAANERMRALREDPAGYTVQNHTAARKAWDAVTQSNFTPESVKNYAAIAREAQRELGGPGMTPRLLPKSVVDQTVAEVGSLPPEQAANRMEALQRQFGPMWTEVLGQMHGKLAPGYATLGRLTSATDAVTRKDLADALKAGPDLRKNLMETDAKDIDRRVDEALAPYARVASQAGAASQLVIREELAAARSLAYSLVAKGESPSNAVKKAANALVFDRYDVADTYLAPKNTLSMVERETARIMRETPAKAFPPAAGGDAALSEDYRREANRSAATRGYWANVTDTASGKLGVEWRTGDGAPVILDNGERVRVYFDDLRNMPPPPRRGVLPRGTAVAPGGAVTRTP